LHLLFFARREIILHKMNQEHDVLLELAEVELSENRNQTDNEVRTIHQELLLLPCQVENYCIILELVQRI
jgi:hypothetical protein